MQSPRLENLIWLFLVAITLASWALGETSSHRGDGVVRIATMVLFTLSMIKVRLVMSVFMEVRNAPFGLRLLCDGWVVLTSGSLMAAYWFRLSMS